MSKPVLQTNPYLKQGQNYQQSLVQNVISSTAVEGIVIKPERLLELLRIQKKSKR